MFIDLLWDIKDHKENCLLELSLYYRIIHKSLETFLDEILQIIILEIQKKKNDACVFWAPVFFLSLLAGKSNNFQTDVTEKQL